MFAGQNKLNESRVWSLGRPIPFRSVPFAIPSFHCDHFLCLLLMNDGEKGRSQLVKVSILSWYCLWLTMQPWLHRHIIRWWHQCYCFAWIVVDIGFRFLRSSSSSVEDLIKLCCRRCHWSIREVLSELFLSLDCNKCSKDWTSVQMFSNYFSNKNYTSISRI